MQLLRTMLFTPGNNWRMIQKARELSADAIIIDLEDAVPMDEKETARVFLEEGIQLIKSGNKFVYVRINSLLTGLTQEDLEYAVQEGLDGIILAKSESKEDILVVDKALNELELQRNLPEKHISIIPLLETAKGVLNVDEIIRASERVVAVCFGALDFTRDMGTNQSEDGIEIFYARSRIALVSTANNVQAIDTPWFDITDKDGLVKETQFVKQLGFRGKLLIHPDQIDAVNNAFTPTEDEITYAKKVIKAFKEAEAQGQGAVSLEGKMIDVASYRQALIILKYIKAIQEKNKINN